MADRAGAFHGRPLPFYLLQNQSRLRVSKILYGEAGYNKSDLDAFFAIIGAKYRSLARILELSVDTPVKLFAALYNSLDPEIWYYFIVTSILLFDLSVVHFVEIDREKQHTINEKLIKENHEAKKAFQDFKPSFVGLYEFEKDFLRVHNLMGVGSGLVISKSSVNIAYSQPAVKPRSFFYNSLTSSASDEIQASLVAFTLTEFNLQKARSKRNPKINQEKRRQNRLQKYMKKLEDERAEAERRKDILPFKTCPSCSAYYIKQHTCANGQVYEFSDFKTKAGDLISSFLSGYTTADGGKYNENSYSYSENQSDKLARALKSIFQSFSTSDMERIKRSRQASYGWASPKKSASVRLTEAQLVYLDSLFEMGERDGSKKVSPEQAMHFMRTAIDHTLRKIFTRSEVLTPVQIKSWFSRRKANGVPATLQKFYKSKLWQEVKRKSKKTKRSKKVKVLGMAGGLVVSVGMAMNAAKRAQREREAKKKRKHEKQSKSKSSRSQKRTRVS